MTGVETILVNLYKFFGVIYDASSSVFSVLTRPAGQVLGELIDQTNWFPLLEDLITLLVEKIIPEDVTLFTFIISFALVWGLTFQIIKYFVELIPFM